MQVNPSAGFKHSQGLFCISSKIFKVKNVNCYECKYDKTCDIERDVARLG